MIYSILCNELSHKFGALLRSNIDKIKKLHQIVITIGALTLNVFKTCRWICLHLLGSKKGPTRGYFYKKDFEKFKNVFSYYEKTVSNFLRIFF